MEVRSVEVRIFGSVGVNIGAIGGGAIGGGAIGGGTIGGGAMGFRRCVGIANGMSC